MRCSTKVMAGCLRREDLLRDCLGARHLIGMIVAWLRRIHRKLPFIQLEGVEAVCQQFGQYGINRKIQDIEAAARSVRPNCAR